MIIRPTTKTKVETCNIELRDGQDNLIAVLKRNLLIDEAFKFVRRHNWTKWVNGTPCNMFIAWN